MAFICWFLMRSYLVTSRLPLSTAHTVMIYIYTYVCTFNMYVMRVFGSISASASVCLSGKFAIRYFLADYTLATQSLPCN